MRNPGLKAPAFASKSASVAQAHGPPSRSLPCSEKEAHNRAVVLEMIGDLPEADAKPPPNMLFICKLNPVTTEEDLEIIFSRFGTITSCDIIRCECSQ